MKNRRILSLFLILAIVGIFTACSDDDKGTSLPSNPTLTLDKKQISLTSVATTGKVEIISNVAWVALKGNSADWLKITPDKGEASADAITVTFATDGNPTVQARTAVVKFAHTMGEKMDSVIIRQEGAIAEPLRFQDSLALVALFEATRGTNWMVSWDLETPMPEWYGIQVDLVDGQTRVVEIVLEKKGLVGSKFPEEMAHLTELKKLVITSEEPTLVFDIPSFIGELKNLEFLALADNGHTGEIPESLYSLPKLKTLHLYNNALTGSLSDKLGNLTELEDLNLERNGLSGKLPSTFGNLTKLEGLILALNKFNGSIPSEFKNCVKLKIAILSYNQFEGTVTDIFDDMPRLETLDLVDNKFTGDLPALTHCSKLYDLRFSNNRGFTGQLPDSWAAIDSLIIIQGRNCNLTGTIPGGYADISQLKYVILDSNNLSGQVPEFARNFAMFSAGYNNFSGSLPTTFVEKNLCNELILSGNDLEGDISMIFTRSNLTILELADMPALTGTLPGGDPDLYAGLSRVDLHNSGFSGSIPGDIFVNSPDIAYINLANCKFTGSLPTEIANARMLNTLKLNGNQLTGEVDAQIKKHANWTSWNPTVNICPQQPSNGLTNCAE